MDMKVFQGTIDRRLDYRIEEVAEDVFTLETKLCLAPDTEWEGHGAFGKLEYAMEHLYEVAQNPHETE